MIVTLTPGSYTVVVESQDGQFGVGLFEIYELGGVTSEQTRILNLSTRCLVRSGEEQPIAGTILGNLDNTGLPKPDRRMLIFGKGPSLPSTIPGRLADPRLDVLTTGASNDQWTTIGIPLQEELTEAGLAPTYSQESALWPTFQPGSYSVRLRSANQTSTGVGLLEFYEY